MRTSAKLRYFAIVLLSTSMACSARSNSNDVRSRACPDGFYFNSEDQSCWAFARTGGGSTCEIRGDGSLWCWGDNTYYGALGIGSLEPHFSPVHVGSAQWKSVACENSHCCGIQSDDSGWCWGDPARGQLGTGAESGTSHVPEAITSDRKWVSIGVGRYHSCGVDTQSQLWCWGLNDGGKQLVPTLKSNDSDWLSVFSLYDKDCALKTDHSMFCWMGGDFTYYNPGSGALIGVAPPVGETGWAKVSDNHYRTYAITLSGKLFDVTTTPKPMSDATDWVALTALDFQTCGLHASGGIECVGGSWFGIGHASDDVFAEDNVLVPEQSGSRWAALTSGYGFICGAEVSTGTKRRCWGHRARGRLGDGTDTDVRTPIPVAGQATVVRLAMSEDQTCVVDENHRSSCWGFGSSCLANDGKVSAFLCQAPAPLRPALGDGNDTWSIAAAGTLSTCAIDASEERRLFCDAGLFADPYMDLNDRDLLARVDGPNGTSHLQALACGRNTCCSLGDDDALWCWGLNHLSAVGADNDETEVNPNDAVQIAGTYTSAISLARYTSCAIDTAGKLWCWGGNDSGVLGVDTPSEDANKHELSYAGQTATWLAVAAQDTFVCAIDRTGTAGASGALYCNGNNALDGTTRGTTMSQLGAQSNWVHVAAGRRHVCLVNDAHQLWCVGDNTHGQLGTGEAASATLPQQVLLDPTLDQQWVAVSAFDETTCALNGTSAGGSQVYCWGYNDYGQVGNGQTWTSTPVDVQL